MCLLLVLAASTSCIVALWMIALAGAVCNSRDQMRFSEQDDLADFLYQLDEDYSKYAGALWAAGVRRAEQLANASVPELEAGGITNGLHAEDIKVRAGMNNNADWNSACNTETTATDIADTAMTAKCILSALAASASSNSSSAQHQ